MDDIILRAFDKAAASHHSKQPASQARCDPGQSDQPAHAPLAGSWEGDERVPAAARLRRSPYVHHGYSQAKETLLQQRAEAVQQLDRDPEPRAEWQQNAHVGQSNGCSEQQHAAHILQKEGPAAMPDVAASQQAALAAWQHAAQVSASLQDLSEVLTASSTGEEQAAERNWQAPPQPPPPPHFVMAGTLEDHRPAAPATPFSARETHEHMVQQAEGVARQGGDWQLADLLKSWYDCGFQTGIFHGRTHSSAC